MAAAATFDLFSVSAAVLDTSDALHAELKRVVKNEGTLQTTSRALASATEAVAKYNGGDTAPPSYDLTVAIDSCKDASSSISNIAAERTAKVAQRREALSKQAEAHVSDHAESSRRVAEAKQAVDGEYAQRVSELMATHGLSEGKTST